MSSGQRSALSEVVVEVQQDGGREQVSVQSQLFELEVVVPDVVLAERAAHVQRRPVVFPGVAAGVRVVAQVTLPDLSQSLLRTHLRSNSTPCLWFLCFLTFSCRVQGLSNTLTSPGGKQTKVLKPQVQILTAAILVFQSQK